MFYFRKKEILLPGQDCAVADRNIRRRTARRYLFLNGYGISHMVIFPERLMMGRAHADRSVTTARYRHSILGFLPKVYARWRMDSTPEGAKLTIRTKPGIITSFVFLFLFALPAMALLLDDGLVMDRILRFAFFFGLGLALLFWESRKTERLLKKLATGE
ncbi:hypothetical protein FUAX_05420 [Fulvitalea axinellae]|uniref:Uncharacterized protein n=1 Tax=Fulvitalea axinellae TaxID=1182444 RepID=A0AAU9DBC8_9BACT|nr:hypothetical protein FUAX_05420 [Fulvitalea axinellae]